MLYICILVGILVSVEIFFCLHMVCVVSLKIFNNTLVRFVVGFWCWGGCWCLLWYW